MWMNLKNEGMNKAIKGNRKIKDKMNICCQFPLIALFMNV